MWLVFPAARFVPAAGPCDPVDSAILPYYHSEWLSWRVFHVKQRTNVRRRQRATRLFHVKQDQCRALRPFVLRMPAKHIPVTLCQILDPCYHQPLNYMST